MTGDDSTSKRKRQYHPKSHGGGGHPKRQRRFDLRQNGRGILVTAGSANHTREAIREAMTVLKSELKESSSTSAPADVSDALDAELAQLKEESERFIPIKDLTKGVCFLQFSSLDDSPNDFVYQVLNRISPASPLVESKPKESEGEDKLEEKKSGRISCRFMSRLVPIEITCAPHMDNFKRSVRLLIEAYFPESDLVLHPENFVEEEEEATSASKIEAGAEGGDVESEVTTVATIPPPKSLKPSFIIPKKASWSVQFERRAGMTTLVRDVVITEIGKMVGENYTVNLTRPEFTVIVEVNNTFCGLSVVRDFARLLKYNIHRLCHPDEDQNQGGDDRKRGNNNKKKVDDKKGEESRVKDESHENDSNEVVQS